ncbi:MAG: DUF1015 family protein [Phycisphaerales bacterium]|nr:DUF1015 family protein [Phycisphaerales bacterium]
MLRIRPFTALRPPANRAASVSSPPYDVVSREEARSEIERHAQSFMRVLRPEATIEGADPYSDAVYQAAREALEALQAEGALIHEDAPSVYLYRQAWRGRAQVGVVCCCHVDDYEQNVIRKHEKTRKDKEDDRTRHVLTTMCNAGPVFLTYRDRAQIDLLVEDDTADRPLFHFNDRSGVTHTGWIAADPKPYVEAFGEVETAWVADGHHRSASAARAAAHLRASGAPDSGDEHEWFLSVLFPASQLTVLPYNRIVKDLNGLTTDAFLDALSSAGALTLDTPAQIPERMGQVGVHVDGRWHTLTFPDELVHGDDPVERLDCALLASRVLGPILDIHDLRTDPRVGFVGGIRGLEDLERRVGEGEAAAAFAMHAVDIEQLIAVADAGSCMPPKSTWFEPKLRSGLFIHELSSSKAQTGAET